MRGGAATGDERGRAGGGAGHGARGGDGVGAARDGVGWRRTARGDDGEGEAERAAWRHRSREELNEILTSANYIDKVLVLVHETNRD